MNKKLTSLFHKSKKLTLTDQTKIVIMSDCHRGSGDNFDNFIKNENIFKTALQYYYEKGFTYIELGDGDDMWEVENYEDIIETHLSTFKQIKKFYDAKRFLMIYGNHDIVKKSKTILKKYFYKYSNKVTKQEEILFQDLLVYESLVLTYKNHNIFLLHGHQVDFLNSTLWRLSRFLVRHIWRPFEQLGIQDPTSSAKIYTVTKNVEKTLEEWSIKNNTIVISGHTHRPIFPKIGHSLYFNDGSCIHSNGITCLEIENGNITLIQWKFEITKEKLVTVKRKVLGGKESILNFFK